MAGEPSTTLQHRWKNLLSWLEGHGFHAQNFAVECREMSFAGNGLFARSACMPRSLLFAVPPKVLMNKMTLKRLYPPDVRVAKALTAVQLISMHLFLWRPKADEDSAEPFFGPYISILPRDFESHPLSWLVLSKFNKADDLRTSLLNRLPPSVLAALHRLYTRFWGDWCKVRTFLVSIQLSRTTTSFNLIEVQQRASSITVTAQGPLNSPEAPHAAMDFLWAWLNVNTRCIYYRLKHAKTDPDNVTMCPIIDFANHTSGQACVTPVPSDSEIRNGAPVNSIGDGLKFVCPDNMKIDEDDEILLTYGLHSNKTLFVEYGFVNVFSEDGPSPGGEVDVQDLVEKVVFADVCLREVIEALLVAEGYWGDWTLHSTADGAQPSWRLITALRLHHLVVAVGSADEDVIQTWRDVVMGKRPRISCENERSWRKTVELLCNMLIERAEKSITTSGFAQDQRAEVSWVGWMLENIQSLWREELFVARAVKECVLRGVEF